MANDIVIDESVIEAISDFVDTVNLVSETNLEDPDIDYTSAKMTIINSVIPQIVELFNDEDMDDKNKFITLVSSMSLVILENFYLNQQRLKNTH